jgi:hypothetical protein
MTETRDEGRKLLFVLFSNDACRLAHALLYAIDLDGKGHAVRIIVEGEATRSLGSLPGQDSRHARLLREALARGLVVGACRTASGGCATGDVDRQVTDAVRAEGIALLDDLDGHAGIASFIAEGYELVVF